MKTENENYTWSELELMHYGVISGFYSEVMQHDERRN